MDFSLLETMRLDEGTIVRLERHLSRLAGSARQFGYAYDESRIRSGRRDGAAHPRGQWRVRLLVARDGAPTIECMPYTRDPRAWRVTFASDPVDSRDPFLANKTTHREVYDTRAGAARRGRRDPVERAWRDHRSDGRKHRGGNRWRARDPATCVRIAGRRPFAASCSTQAGYTNVVLTRDDVTRASRLWLINSLREWIDVVLA